MKHSNLKFPCLIAVFYFGMNVNAQEIPRDTVVKEQKIEEVVMIGYGTRKKQTIRLPSVQLIQKRLQKLRF